MSKIYGFVYLFVSQSTGWYKIGCSSEKNPENRLNWIRESAPGMEIDLVDYIRTDDFEHLEGAFHNAFRDVKTTRQERLKASADHNLVSGVPTKEWYKLDAHQVELFRALAQTTGVSGAIILMIRKVRGLQGLVEAYKRDNDHWADRYDRRVQRLEDLKHANEDLKQVNAQLQAENRRLQAALVAAGLETEGGA